MEGFELEKDTQKVKHIEDRIDIAKEEVKELEREVEALKDLYAGYYGIEVDMRNKTKEIDGLAKASMETFLKLQLNIAKWKQDVEKELYNYILLTIAKETKNQKEILKAFNSLQTTISKDCEKIDKAVSKVIIKSEENKIYANSLKSQRKMLQIKKKLLKTEN